VIGSVGRIPLMKRKLSNKGQPKFHSWELVASSVVEGIRNGNIYVNFGDSSTILLPSDCVRAVSEIVPESAIRNLLLKCLLDAESQSVGGAFATLSIIAGAKFQSESFGRRFILENLKNGLSSMIGSVESNIVFDAISIAGRRGKVMLDASDVQKTELTYGTQVCRWKPPQSFFEAVGQSKISVQNCKVVFIDGIIESVAECHKLFQISYETRTPIVIFARGFSEEVIATAALNVKRQTSQIIPVLIPFDEIGINALGDLASCFGSEAVSSDKGQLISNTDVSGCKTAERITASLSATEIEFKNNMIDDVTRKLSARLSNCDENQSKLIRQRINSLGTGSVTIKIGSDKKSLSGLQRDRVDFGLRYVKACMSSGVIDFCGLTLPITAMNSGKKCSDSFKEIVQKCGAILEVDRCG
jgi:hypothetical protein